MIFTPSQKQAPAASKSGSQDSLSQIRSVSWFVLSPLLSLFVFCVHMALPFFSIIIVFCVVYFIMSVGGVNAQRCILEKILSGAICLPSNRYLFEIVLLIQNEYIKCLFTMGKIHFWRSILISPTTV